MWMSAEVKGIGLPVTVQKKISLTQNHSYDSKVIIWLSEERFCLLFA